MEDYCTMCICCGKSPQIMFKLNGKKMKENKYITDLITEISGIKLLDSNDEICRQCLMKLENYYVFSSMIKINVGKRYNNGKRQISPKLTPDSKDTVTVTKKRKLVFSPDNHTFNDHCYSNQKIQEEPFTTNQPKAKEESPHQFIRSIQVSNRMVELKTQLNRVEKESVLGKKRCLEKLQDAHTNIVMDMVEEMSEKVPYLFEVLVAAFGKITLSSLAPLSAIYGIILFHRNHMLSAWQRCMSAICLKGQLEDSALTILSNFGVALSPSSKLRLEDEACASSKQLVIEMLRNNPLAKITGDNLDVYIKRDVISTDRKNKDVHLFASNILFPRIANPDMENKKPVQHDVTVNDLKMNESQRSQLLNVYKDVIGNIFASNIKECEWMATVKRSKHEYFTLMSKKSITAQLPIINANEAKHEDCLKIMDGYEKILSELYVEAHGTDDKLKQYKVVVGGDQLTRSRLQEAKALRSLSSNPKMRFDDLEPIVVELWHTKQDLLEKLFKALYDQKTQRTYGSMAYFKSKLQRTDINGKVKGHFKSHMQFFMLIGEKVVAEQGMEFLERYDITNEDIVDESDKSSILDEILNKFLVEYNYIPPVYNEVIKPIQKDEMYNYFTNVSHWYLHIATLNKIAKEGNIMCIVPALLMSLPLFYHHSTLSKYLVECINYIVTVEHYLSPLMKLRVLEGSFVNVKGGKGNNVESDLFQEHAVRHQKSLIKQLGANKSQKAIERASGAAGAITSIYQNINMALCITPKSSRHTKIVSDKDKKIVEDVVHELKPFRFTAGRTFEGYCKLGDTIFACIDGSKMELDFDVILKRLLSGYLNYGENVDEDDDSDSDQDELPDL